MVALSFAIGVFVGMSPLLGIHLLLAVLIAWVFKLNKIATFTGVLITNPWTIIPIYSFSTWIGVKVLGMQEASYGVSETQLGMGALLGDLGSLLKPFVVGSCIFGAASAFIGYLVVLTTITTVRERRASAVLKLEDDEGPVS